MVQINLVSLRTKYAWSNNIKFCIILCTFKNEFLSKGIYFLIKKFRELLNLNFYKVQLLSHLTQPAFPLYTQTFIFFGYVIYSRILQVAYLTVASSIFETAILITDVKKKLKVVRPFGHSSPYIVQIVLKKKKIINCLNKPYTMLFKYRA